MKREQWEDLIGKIDPVYVREAEHWKKMPKRTFLVKRVLPMAACICILLIGATAGWNYMFGSKETDTTANMAETAMADFGDRADVTTEETALAEEERGKADFALEDTEKMESGQAFTTQAEGTAKESIYINNVTELNTVCIDMVSDHETQLSAEELQDYYGVQILPEELPEGLELSEGQVFTVAYDSQNQVAEDENTIIYENKEKNTKLTVSARTVDGGIMTEFADENLKDSSVNGVAVTIGAYRQEDVEYYLAIYKEQSVTVTVTSKNLTEESFLTILQELCGKQQEKQ